jgi:hypothetical protein
VTATVNGYARPAAASAIPVITLPPGYRRDEPPATPGRRPWVQLHWPSLSWPDGDAVITWAMAATVALVAVDAAIVSYSHIHGLATGQWGSGAETGIQAQLLPLSIDGVVVEASLVKLYAARHQAVGRQRLATFMLWLGIVATVAANVAHGLPSSLLPPVAHVVIMAVLSAWPAGALIGSVEMAMGLVRSMRDVAAAVTGDTAAGDSDSDNPDTTADTDTLPDQASDTPDSPPPGDAGDDRKPPPPPAPPARPVGSDPVTTAIRKHAQWRSGRQLDADALKQVASQCGVSKRTVERRVEKLRKAG